MITQRFPGRLFVLPMLLLFLAHAKAQPEVTLSGISMAWPDVALSLSVKCNGTQVLDLAKSNFFLTENGVPVNGFTLHCPDTLERCYVSVALVFDVSGSMIGIGIDGEKAAGKAFLQSLDGVHDEACVFKFSGIVTEAQTMTTNKALLQTAINNLVAAGSTAVWDACMQALNRIKVSGVNPCRAMIVLSDGMDNGSTATYKQVIALAKSLGVTIYSIGLGNGIDSRQLQDIADQTGGSAHFVDDPRRLEDVYKLIASVIRYQTKDCEIHYTGSCIDGGARSIRVIVADVCGGADTASISFTAPDNTGRTLPLYLRLDRDTVAARRSVSLRLAISDTAYAMALPRTDVSVRFDSTLLRFDRIAIPSGAFALPGSVVVTRQTPGSIAFRFTQLTAIDDTGTLCALEFTAADVADTSLAQVHLERYIFDDGCLVPVLSDGAVRIIPCRWTPTVNPTGSIRLCAGDTLTLCGERGYRDYFWYRDTTLVARYLQEIRVTTPGRYRMVAMDRSGCIGEALPVDVLGVANETVTAGDTTQFVVRPGQRFEVYCRVRPALEKARTDSGSAMLGWSSPLLTMERMEWLAQNASSDSIADLAVFTLRAVPLLRSATVVPLAFTVSLPNGCIGTLALEHPTVLIDGLCEKLVQPLTAPVLRNAPNPFSSSTSITVDLSAPAHLHVTVLDAFGREVVTLADAAFEAGSQTLAFDATGLAPGLYVARATAGGKITTRTMLLLR